MSEAEDWLGREASRPLGDSDGCLYRKQAMVKNRKPSTWGERGAYLAPGPPEVPVPARRPIFSA